MTELTENEEPKASRTVAGRLEQLVIMPNSNKDIKRIRAQHNHIARLQTRNKELMEALVQERDLRKKAWAYYKKRLKSNLLMIFDIYMLSIKKQL